MDSENIVYIRERILSEIPSAADYRQAIKSVDRYVEDAYIHILHMHFFSLESIDRDSRCLLPPDNPNYIEPTTEQIQSVLKYIISLGYGLHELSRMLRLTESEAAQLANFIKIDAQPVEIPYCIWCLLTQLAGLKQITMLKVND